MDTKIVALCVVFSLIMGVGLVAKLSSPIPESLTIEQTGQHPAEQVLADTVNPGPSPLLLFATGLFGIVCVLINERQRQRNRLFPLPPQSQPSQQNTQAS